MSNISLASISQFIQTEGVRYTKAALPFLSLYRPLSRPISLATSGLHSLSSSAQLMQNVNVKNVLDASIQVISLTSTYFVHPLGQMVSTGYDLIQETLQCAQHLQARDYNKASQSLLHILNSSLYLALYTYGGPQLQITSSLVQLGLAAYHARSEYQQDHSVEATSHFVMALVKAYQCGQTVRELYKPVSTIERRAVIEMSSESTKVCVADVDTKTNEVVKIILNDSQPISSDQTIAKIQVQCQELGAQKMTIRTKAFHKPQHVESVAHEIRTKTKLKVRVISPKAEEEIGLHNGSSEKKESSSRRNKVIVTTPGSSWGESQIRKCFTSKRFVNQAFLCKMDGKEFRVILLHNPKQLDLSKKVDKVYRQDKIFDWQNKYTILFDKESYAPLEVIYHFMDQLPQDEREQAQMFNGPVYTQNDEGMTEHDYYVMFSKPRKKAR